MTGNEAGTKKSKLSKEREVAFETLFRDLPKTFHELKTGLLDLRTEFNTRVGDALEESLNEYLRQQNRSSPQDCALLAVMLGDLTKQMGVMIACPGSGEPCVMTVGTVSGKLEYRFNVPHTDPDEIGSIIKYSSNELPNLRLTPEPSGLDFFLTQMRTANTCNKRRSNPPTGVQR